MTVDAEVTSLNKPSDFAFVRFGVQLPLWDYHVRDQIDFATIRDLALLAEELGYDYVSFDDHLSRGRGGVFFESWTTLTTVAALTSRIRLMTTVLCNMYRFPSVLAKMAATLDQISGGRLDIGVGAGWKEEEAIAFGIPWDGPRGRLDRLEEAIQIMKALWTGEPVSFAGKYYSLDNALCAPRPVQRPHPPIWVGGGGEKRTLRIAAALANGVNFGNPGASSGPDDTFGHFAHKKAILAEHCRAVGRDMASLRLSGSVNLMLWGRDKAALLRRMSTLAIEQGLSAPERGRLLSGIESGVDSVDDCISFVRRMSALGATDLSLTRPTEAGLRRFATEVVPRL